MKLLIKNGRLIDPDNAIDANKDIAIADGKIFAIADAGSQIANFTPDQTIDANGWVVCPGLVDLGARLREPGYEHKATLISEMNAAVAGGVTTLVCPPDTDPVLDEPGLVEMLKYKASNLNQARIYPLGALTVGLKGKKITEMAELADAGCIGFSHANEDLPDPETLLRIFQYAQSFGYRCWLQPQDPYLAKNGMAHAGHTAAALGLSGISYVAETIALHMIFDLMRVTKAKVHLCRLSTKEGIDLVRQAKKEGLDLTCDVDVHHLHLTDESIGFFDTNARLSPPLRSEADRQAITEGLLDGTIDAICSDHTPVDNDEKLLPFGEASAGATALELFLSLAVKWAQAPNNQLSNAISKITCDPARVLGLASGNLSVGRPADICIFDPKATWTVTEDKLISQGKHTPFIDQSIPGIVRYTLVGGQVVFKQ